MKTKLIMLLCSILLVLGFATSIAAQEELPTQKVDSFITVVPHAEIGFVSVLSHVYRSGSEALGNRTFNYVSQGGQDILFPAARVSVDTIIAGQHRVSFLYQPLTLVTKTVAGANGTAPVVIAGKTFAAGTPLDLTYGFDFYRLSYLYDFLPEPESELGVGLSLQLRNANIIFSSVNGGDRVAQNNVGLVPIIKLKAAHWFSPQFGIDFEGDGFYASNAFFNGSGKPFEGWIWDASLQVKTRVFPWMVAFLSVRSIGGGALGSNAYDTANATSSAPGLETYNALATFIASIGVSIE